MTNAQGGMTFLHRTEIAGVADPEQKCGPHAIMQFDVVNHGPGSISGIALKLFFKDKIESGKQLQNGEWESVKFASGLQYQPFPVGVAKAVVLEDGNGACIRVIPGDDKAVPLEANTSMGIVIISPDQDWSPKEVMHVTGSKKTSIAFDKAAMIKVPNDISTLLIAVGIVLLSLPTIYVVLFNHFSIRMARLVEDVKARLALQVARASSDASVPDRATAQSQLELLERALAEGAGQQESGSRTTAVTEGKDENTTPTPNPNPNQNATLNNSSAPKSTGSSKKNRGRRR